MLKSTKNIKHKVILMLLYSGELRRSELINLKITDIDSSRMLIKIRESKGKKDRYVQLSKVVLQVLMLYYKQLKPNDWLIEGRNGRPYSATSVEKVVEQSALRARINKKVTPHMLRHSFVA